MYYNRKRRLIRGGGGAAEIWVIIKPNSIENLIYTWNRDGDISASQKSREGGAQHRRCAAAAARRRRAGESHGAAAAALDEANDVNDVWFCRNGWYDGMKHLSNFRILLLRLPHLIFTRNSMLFTGRSRSHRHRADRLKRATGCVFFR